MYLMIKPIEYKKGDRVLVGILSTISNINFTGLKGEVIKIDDKGWVLVKLPRGEYKYSPQIVKLDKNFHNDRNVRLEFLLDISDIENI